MLNRIVKSFISTALVALLLMVSLAYFFPSLVEEAKLQKDVNNVLSRMLGKEVSSKGVSFTLVPDVTFSVEEINIKDKDAAKTTLKDAKIYVNAMDLLFARELRATYNVHVGQGRFSGRLFYDNIDGVIKEEPSDVALELFSPFKARIAGNVDARQHRMTFSDVTFSMQQTSGKMDLKIADLSSVPYFTGKIDFDILDLAEIQNAVANVKAVIESGQVLEVSPEADDVNHLSVAEVESSKPVWNTEPLLKDWMKNGWEIELFISELRHKNYDAGVVSATIDGVAGHIKTSVKSGKFFGGELDISSEVKVEGDALDVSKEIAITDVSIGKLVEAFAGIDRLEGDGHVRLSVHTRGVNQDEMVRQMGGAIEAHMLNGVFKGVDVAKLADSSKDNIDKLLKEQGNNTDILSVDAKATIEKGMIFVDDFLVAMPFGQKIYLEGNMDVHSSTLDMTVTPAVKAVVGLKLPLKVTGHLHKPKVFIDPLATVIDNVDQLEVLKNTSVKKVLGKVQSIGGGLLGGLGKVVGEAAKNIDANAVQPAAGPSGNPAP